MADRIPEWPPAMCVLEGPSFREDRLNIGLGAMQARALSIEENGQKRSFHHLAVLMRLCSCLPFRF